MKYTIMTNYHDGDHSYVNNPEDESDDIDELKRICEEHYSFTEKQKKEHMRYLFDNCYSILESMMEHISKKELTLLSGYIVMKGKDTHHN